MAFTMLLAGGGKLRPGLVCDRCEQIITGADARILWGPQYVDLDDRKQPFTSVANVINSIGLGDIPVSVLVACGEECQDHLIWTYRDNGLVAEWLPISDYVSWLVLMVLKIDPAAVMLNGVMGRP